MPKVNYKKHLYALIVVGGGGTRLWPKSRNATPKQFLRLFESKTLTQITAYRFSKMMPWERIFVVTTTEAYKKEILKEVPELSPANVVYEPMRRNTAPAHGLGAWCIYKRDPDAVIINDYSDHLVEPEGAYLRNMKVAAAAAYSGDWLVAVGIRPTYPNIGYGHIKKGKRWGRVEHKLVYKVEKFTEKPPLALAKKYTASGNYYWNAGQYIWRADVILKALRTHEPKVGKALERIGEVMGTSREKSVMKREYEKMPEISVDYAVSEKANNFLLLVADYAWADIGDWKEVWANLPKDNVGNVVIDGKEPGGEVINIGTSDALIHTNGRLIAVIDVDNVVVVDTEDALLVCSKSRAQNVKRVVQQLKKQKRNEYL